MSSKTPSDNLEKTESAPKYFVKLFGKFSVAVLLAYGLGILLAIGVLVLITSYYFNKNSDVNNSISICETNPDLKQAKLQVGATTLTTEIVETAETQAKGLSGRSCIDKERAMLFTYPQAGNYCFWMKDMRFNIDMVWLDTQKSVVTIKHNVSPDSYPNAFCPDQPAQYVVEVMAGKALAENWHIGTQFDF